ncbi:MAG: MiaB/RimO family radical SAM methylthiotransferase [Synergistaceae bacterium]|nr:MiaB/RimO family radical SAM methylthiotransferase [Synergistaceae bacterium]
MNLSDKKIKLDVLGCRTNSYEGDAILSSLIEAGATQSENWEIYILISCTITAIADRKCKKLLRRARRENKNGVICCLGCFAETLTQEQARELGINILLGNRLKHLFVPTLEEFLTDAQKKPIFKKQEDVLHNNIWDSQFLTKPCLHTRAFVKVQDGCNHFCSYCTVPFVRGLPVSRDMADTLAEVRSLVSNGCREIVLTGVHLGLHTDLPFLVEELSKVEGLARLRFGSIEPLSITKKLLQTLSSSPIFMPHLHIPLQSGCNRTLRNMKRGYTVEQFAEIMQNSRDFLGEDMQITTDFLLGFPTETEADFEESLSFLIKQKFGHFHVFPFSSRTGTRAAGLPPLAPQIIRSRQKRAITTSKKLDADFLAKFRRTPQEILVEEVKDDIVTGHTKNFIRIKGKFNAKVNDLVILKDWQIV